MKNIISFITIFLSVIFFISCKANTGPIEQSEKTQQLMAVNGLKSSGPVLGQAYLWVFLTTDGSTTSSISLKFGDGTTSPQSKGEEVKFNGNIEHISPTANENPNSYAFQSGTITGVIEILSETQVNVSFSRNISPYLKINDVVCTAQQ